MAHPRLGGHATVRRRPVGALIAPTAYYVTYIVPLRPDLRKEQQKRLIEMMKEAKGEEEIQKDRALKHGVPLSAFGVEKLEPLGNEFFFARYYDHWKTVALDEYADFIGAAEQLTLTDPLPELFNSQIESYIAANSGEPSSLIKALIGISLKPTKEPSFAEHSQEASPDAIRESKRRIVRVFLTSPTHPSAAESHDDGGNALQVEIDLSKSLDLWKKLADKVNSQPSLSFIEVLAVHSKLIRAHTTVTESGAFVLLRFYCEKQSSWNPCFKFHRATQFYRSLNKDLDWLRRYHSLSHQQRTPEREMRPRFAMLTAPQYLKLLLQAEGAIYLANPAISLIQAAGTPRYVGTVSNFEIVQATQGILEMLATQGRQIRVFFPGPNSATLRALSRVYDADRIKEIQTNLSTEIEAWRRLAQRSGPTLKVSTIENEPLLDHIVMTQDRALIAPYRDDVWNAMLQPSGSRWLVVGNDTLDYRRYHLELEALAEDIMLIPSEADYTSTQQKPIGP